MINMKIHNITSKNVRSASSVDCDYCSEIAIRPYDAERIAVELSKDGWRVINECYVCCPACVTKYMEDNTP